MIKKEKLQAVLDMIDAEHEVRNIQQLASNSQNDNTKLAASTKLLEILGISSKDKKTTASTDGTNVQLVIEE